MKRTNIWSYCQSPSRAFQIVSSTDFVIAQPTIKSNYSKKIELAVAPNAAFDSKLTQFLDKKVAFSDATAWISIDYTHDWHAFPHVSLKLWLGRPFRMRSTYQSTIVYQYLSSSSADARWWLAIRFLCQSLVSSPRIFSVVLKKPDRRIQLPTYWHWQTSTHCSLHRFRSR